MTILAYKPTESKRLINIKELHWVDEKTLFTEFAAECYVIQGFRKLNDLTQVILTGRPVLYVLDSESDFHHINLLMNKGDFCITPVDGVIINKNYDYLQKKYSWIWDHKVNDINSWLSNIREQKTLSNCMNCYNKISKQEYWDIFRKSRTINLGQNTHFLKIIGNNRSLCSVFIDRSNCISCDVKLNYSPSLIFYPNNEEWKKNDLEISQSVLIISPFCLQNDIPIEQIINNLRTKFSYTFLLHKVRKYKETSDGVVGCIYGEYVL